MTKYIEVTPQTFLAINTLQIMSAYIKITQAFFSIKIY